MPRLNPYTHVPAFNQSLADHLKAGGWLTYTEIPLGAAQSETVGRADVLAIKKSYNVRIAVYECKVSRGDFNSDVQSGKYERYFERAHQVYFAVPKGLVTLKEIPDNCGLITKSEKGWHVQRAAKVHTVEVNQNLLLQCLFREQEEKPAVRALKDRILWDENAALSERAKNIGYDIKRRLGSPEDEWGKIAEARNAMGDLIGGDPGGSIHALVGAVDRFVRELQAQRQLPAAIKLIELVPALLQPPGSWLRDAVPERLQRIMDTLTAQPEETPSVKGES